MVQTAYSLTDMAWIGMVGSDAVAAVGAAGMYTWLLNGAVAMAKMGGQVRVAPVSYTHLDVYKRQGFINHETKSADYDF